MSANGFDEVASCVVTQERTAQNIYTNLNYFNSTNPKCTCDSGISEIQNATQLNVITNAIYFSKIKSNSCILPSRKLKFIFGQFFRTV